MTIYLDLILLSNFLLDYSLISYTGIINQEKMRFWRIFLASLVALSGLVLFFVQIKIIFIILRIFFSLLIIFIAFSYKSYKKFLKNLVIFYFLNYLVAGIIVSYDFEFTNNAISIDLKQPITWYLLVISFIFANVLTYIYKVIEENHRLTEGQLLDVDFQFLQKKYHIKGFIDSGNRAFTPYDQKPIVFIDQNVINEMIDETFLKQHHIPFTHVSMNTVYEHFITIAFKPDYFRIVQNKKSYDKDVYLAISPNLQSKELTFQAILNSQILI